MIQNAVGDADEGDHSVLSKQRFSLHLGCEPCWLRNEHQLFTSSGQSNWPAAPISAIPHFLYPSFGKSGLQVSGQRGLIQVLKARNFRAGDWLSSANCYEQSELWRVYSERSEPIVANSRDCFR